MILTVDASGLLHRMMFVNRNLAVKRKQELIESGLDEGKASAASLQKIKWQTMCWLFLRSLIPKCEEFNVTRVYLLWDYGKCRYRSAIYENYKGKREPEDPSDEYLKGIKEYIIARAYLNNRCPEIGFCSLLIPTVEADDIGFFIAYNYDSPSGEQVGIHLTDDRDWYLNLFPSWSIHHPRKNLTITYEQFRNKMNSRHYEKPQKFLKRDPRIIYLYEKACCGDSDEIPRIDTPARAKQIADYLCGCTTSLSNDLMKVLHENKDNIERNLKLANTDWLIRDPTIVNVQKFFEVATKKVEFDDQKFLYLSNEINLNNYLWRWKKIVDNFSYL